MSKFFKIFVAVAFVLLLATIPVLARDNSFWVRIVDANGNEITTGLTAYITTDGTYIPATVYSDGNRAALTNTTTGADPGTDAVVKWWGEATEFGLYMKDANRWQWYPDISTTDHRVTFTGWSSYSGYVPQSTTPKSPPGTIFIGTVALNTGITYIATGALETVTGEATSWAELAPAS